MNRLKLWLFALLVMGLTAAGMRHLLLDLRRAAIEGLDDRLALAQGRAEAAERTFTAELGAVAALAAADGGVLERLQPPAAPAPIPAAGKRRPAPPPPAPDPEQLDAALSQAAANAVSSAESALGLSLGGGRQVFAVTREGFARRKAAGGDPEALALLQDALDRKVSRRFVLLGGKLHVGAAVPAGEAGALAVLAPVDPAWVGAAVARTGAGITLALAIPGQKPVASGRYADIDDLARKAERAGRARAARAAGGDLTPVDVGLLPPVDVSPSGLQLPRLPSVLGALPADRVLVRPLPGVKDGQLVLVAAGAAVLTPLVRLEWTVVAALALGLVLTLVFSFLVKPTEVAAPVPSALVEVATRIERGDWSARAPALAGKVGTVAAALNRAVEAAQRGEAGPATTQEFFARGGVSADPAPPAAEDPFSFPARPVRPAAGAAPTAPPVPAAPAAPEPQAVNDTARLDGKHLTGSAWEAAPVAAARAAPEPLAPTPAPSPAPAELLGAAARAAPPGASPGASDEEQHWRDTFRDFVRTRGECGESAEGLTYERFRQKLESNKATLVAKYGCKTVRFQVYVKEGKAALKATPVR
jgi:hypothetical protein